MAATLTNLRLWVRSRADMTNSTFRTDTELDRVINAAYAKLWRKLIGVYVDYFSTTTDIVLISGTDSYALGAISPAIRKLRGVDLLHSAVAGDFTSLKRFEWGERDRWANAVSSADSLRYCLMGSNLIFTPVPKITKSVRVRYVPEVIPLTVALPNLAPEIKEGWEEFIVLDAAITLLRDEESETRELVDERDAAWKDIAEDAAVRDAEAPEKMLRIRTRDEGDPEEWS